MRSETIECWKVEIITSDTLDEEEFYFASESLALLAIEWAYTNRVAEVRKRAVTVEEYPDLHNTSWKLEGVLGKKLVWWEPFEKGLVRHREYFTITHDVVSREIID